MARKSRPAAIPGGSPAPKRTPRRRGRPSARTDERQGIILGAIVEGATEEIAAARAGVDRHTLRAWVESDRAFQERVQWCKAQADGAVQESLYHAALGNRGVRKVHFTREGTPIPYVEGIPANVTAQIFWLKNRQAEVWRDRQDHVLNDGRPVQVTVVEVPMDPSEVA